MCGVFGYVGEARDLGSDLLRGLRTLEYRGYDSWGVALGTREGIAVEKRVGRINGGCPVFEPSDIGFGHTRWATHGGVVEPNAHPHLDCSGRLAVVHNGIVENHQELRSDLLARGHRFRSETDTEVVAHLIEEEVLGGRDLAAALAAAFARLEGFNAIVAMDADTREMAATKRVSPLVAGWNDGGAYIASDALALRPHVDRVVYLEDDHLVRLDKSGLRLLDRVTLSALEPVAVGLERVRGDVELGDFPHFMAKEMAEQPAVVARLAEAERVAIESLARTIAQAPAAFLVGCGTAANAAQTGRYLFARLAARSVHSVVASEFAAYEHAIAPRSLVIALSQSGETVDVLEAMAMARRRGAALGALVNVEHSTLDRLVEHRVHLGAGPEQCVLATKSYTAKVAALLLAAHALAGDWEAGATLVARAADGVAGVLAEERVTLVRQVAREIYRRDHLFVIGRGLSYPTALEAALKIKEVSYIHAEGFPGGELKHGAIALIEPGTPCLVFAPNDETRANILSAAAELRARGGFIIGVGPVPAAVFDVHLPTADVGVASPIVDAVPAQLLGYHAALLRGNDPDRPRNLAKSVTVK